MWEIATGGFWKSVFKNAHLYSSLINVSAEGPGALLGSHFTAYTMNVSTFTLHALFMKALGLSVSLAPKLGVRFVGTCSAGSASENYPLSVINLAYFCPSCM